MISLASSISTDGKPHFLPFCLYNARQDFQNFLLLHTFAQPILQQEMEISLDTTSMKSNAPIKSLHEMGFSMVEEVRKLLVLTERSLKLSRSVSSVATVG